MSQTNALLKLFIYLLLVDFEKKNPKNIVYKNNIVSQTTDKLKRFSPSLLFLNFRKVCRQDCYRNTGNVIFKLHLSEKAHYPNINYIKLYYSTYVQMSKLFEPLY